MKLKSTVLMMALLLCFIMTAASAQTTVHRFGDHPFNSPELSSADELREMIKHRKDDLAEGFTKAGAQDLYAQLMIQLDELEIATVQVQPGDTFSWMMFAHRGKVYVRDDVNYAGKNPVRAYAFDVEMNYKAYTFVVPAICGNLSLAGIADIPNVPPTCNMVINPTEVYAGETIVADATGSFDEDGTIKWAKFDLIGPGGAQLDSNTVESAPFLTSFTLPEEGEYTINLTLEDNRGAVASDACSTSVKALPPAVVIPPNKAPECMVNVTPKRVFTGETIVADASKSVDSDGTIAAVKFDLVDAYGNVVATKNVTSAPFIAEFIVPSAGDFQVTSTVSDDDGDTSSCGVMGIHGVGRFGWLADIGYVRQFDPATYILARVGVEYRFNESFSFMLLAGGFPKVHDDEGASAFTVDGLLTFNSRGSIWTGFGIGAWITDGDDDVEHENSQIDAIWNIGLRILGDEDSSTSIFFEARSGLDEFDSLEEFGRFIIGFRFIF